MEQEELSPQEKALLSAAKKGATEQVRKLLDLGTPIDCLDRDDCTPLIWAAYRGHVATAELLLKRGAIPDPEAYLAACQACRITLIRKLLALGVNAYATAFRGNRALNHAARYATPKLVDLLIHFSGFGPGDNECYTSYALVDCCRYGNIHAAKRMLEWGVSPNGSTPHGGPSALSYACLSGNLELVKLLLQYGADPVHLERFGREPLDFAMQAKPFNPAVAELLLKNGADINGCKYADQTPLQFAKEEGSRAALAWALKHGAKKEEKKGPKDRTEELLALAEKSPEKLQEWIQRHQNEVNLHYALREACLHGSIRTLEALLTTCDDFYTSSEFDIRSDCLLSSHSKAFSEEKVRLLLQYGADPNRKDCFGCTALHEYLTYPEPDFVNILFTNSAVNIHITNNIGDTPLMIACSNGKYGLSSIIEKLITLGADIHAANQEGYTALHRAAEGASADTLRLLLEAGASIEATAQNGFTPLLCAEDATNIRLLLEAGANLFHRSHCGLTALITAMRSEDTDTILTLLQMGQKEDGSNVWLTHVRRILDRKVKKCCTPRIARELSKSYCLFDYEDSNRAVSSLTRACAYLDEHATTVLLEAGVDINCRDLYTHRTPLFAACSPTEDKLKPSLVKLLLKYHADVNAEDDFQQTALHALCMLPFSKEREQVKQLLIQAGADAGKKDIFGKTAEDYEYRGSH